MIVRNEKKPTTGMWKGSKKSVLQLLCAWLPRALSGAGHARPRDFIPELDLVLELDGRVIGSILYTKAKLSDAAGKEKKSSRSALSASRRNISGWAMAGGLWKRLFEKATALGFMLLLFSGSPANYGPEALKAAKLNVCADNGRYPAAMLVKELVPGALDGRKWVYRDSPVMAFSEEEAQRYDDTLEKLEKNGSPRRRNFIFYPIPLSNRTEHMPPDACRLRRRFAALNEA